MAVVDWVEVPYGAYFLAETGLRKATRAKGFDQVISSEEVMDHTLAVRLWDLFSEIVGT
jgi:hypothetical protein